jgi:nucleoporin SEH1
MSAQGNHHIFELRSPRLRSPFLSFDITHDPNTRHTFLALLSRDSLLTVYENEEPESLTSWTALDAITVLSDNEKPKLGEEVSFRVKFDPNLEPSYNAIREGVPRDGLGLVVAGMGTARVWRSRFLEHEVSLGAGRSWEFYMAADLPGHRGLVRDVSWAPGSIRGYDIVATVCKDGLVRVFEVRTPHKDGPAEQENGKGKYAEYPVSQTAPRSSANGGPGSGGPSGIGAELATVRLGSGNRHDGQRLEGQVPHVAKEVARLDAHRGAVWRARFDDDGQMLGTTGDDGKLMLWRRLPSGGWARSGELAMDRSTSPEPRMDVESLPVR